MSDREDRKLAFHRWVWKTFSAPVGLFLRLRYGPFVCEEAPPIEGGYLVLPNHSCGADQFFVGLSFRKRHMYFLVSEHSFRRRIVGFFMRHLAGPISRVKGSVDASATLALLRKLRKGIPVCIFPEGDRCWDGRTARLHPSTAKLLRTAGVPIVTWRLEGGYLSDPRWGHSLRRGRIHGGVVNIYPAAQIKAMRLPEIEALIDRDLRVNADEAQQRDPIPYRGKRRAEGLEEALYLCPRCGSFGTLHGRGNRFACGCGLNLEYDEYGRLQGDSPLHSVSEWSDWQLAELHRIAGQSGDYFTDAGASLWALEEAHRMRRLEKGTVRLNANGLHLGEHHFLPESLEGLALCHFSGRETLMFSHGGHSYELRLEGTGSRRKYYQMLTVLREPTADAART